MKKTKRCVELLTVGLWHDSVGDIALMQATAQQLSIRGVPVMCRSISTGSRPCVVGGGYLLSNITSGMWSHVLRPFQVRGGHFLNAVGVGGRGDYGFVGDWKYVSVRDHVSRDFLAPSLPKDKEIHLVPCPAVLLEVPNVTYLRRCPGGEVMKDLPLQGFVVVDCEAEWAHGKIKEPLLPLDTRPWMKKGWLGKPLRNQTRSPEMMMGIMKCAKAVITESLHMSIMAMAVGVPFVVSARGGTAAKPAAYFKRAGIPEIVVKPNANIVNQALELHTKMLAVRKLEQDRARKHLDAMVELMDEPV